MRRHTNRALLLSFVLHIGLMLVLSPFVVNHFDAEKESISAEILKVDPEKRVKRQVLPPRLQLMSRAASAETSSDSPASPTYAPRVSAPKAPVHTDVVPDVVTHADIPKADRPSTVSNTSFDEGKTLGGPVAIEGQNGRGAGGVGVGFGGPDRQGRGFGMGLGSGMGVSEAGLDIPVRIDTGLGIFGTEVKPGHGLVGQVYVPGAAIFRMPDFDSLCLSILLSQQT
ncbi:hypothetical protein F4Z99_12660 [Candidatus Poribacteria bacterium]|nr:hypothetical protein [Candidatus Poribacteria bacterium]